MKIRHWMIKDSEYFSKNFKSTMLKTLNDFIIENFSLASIYPRFIKSLILLASTTKLLIIQKINFN